MKTKKQEAQEIVDRFEYQIKDLDGEMHLSLDQARQCALIALDIVIEALMPVDDNGKAIYVKKAPWMRYQKLKQEIESCLNTK